MLGRSIHEARRELQYEAWRSIGPIRRTCEIRAFLYYLKSLKSEKFCAKTPFEHLLAMEMPGLVTSAESVAEAALRRRQSIGAHYIVE